MSIGSFPYPTLTHRVPVIDVKKRDGNTMSPNTVTHRRSCWPDSAGFL